MNFFQKLKARLTLREAVRKAQEAYARTGKRHYVMPYGYSRKLVVMDRYNFRKLKQKRYITYKAFIRDLERECFYFTPYGTGKRTITPAEFSTKREQYMSWYAECIRRAKSIKKMKRDEVLNKG